MRLGALALVLFVLCLSAVPAQAVTTYTYTGDYFAWLATPAGVYTTADRITGSFTVGDSFLPEPRQWADRFTDGVLSYSFTDGHQTLTGANSTGDFYLGLGLNTMPSAAWHIQIYTPTSSIVSWNIAGRYDTARLDTDIGGNEGCSYSGCDGSHVGTWTVSVPEPMSLVLVIAGIGGLAIYSARDRRNGRRPAPHHPRERGARIRPGVA